MTGNAFYKMYVQSGVRLKMETSGKWEYYTMKYPAGGFLGGKVDDFALNQRLNELGIQGWELTTSLTTQMGYGSSRDIILILKRLIK